jgi:TonB family protein
LGFRFRFIVRITNLLPFVILSAAALHAESEAQRATSAPIASSDSLNAGVVAIGEHALAKPESGPDAADPLDLRQLDSFPRPTTRLHVVYPFEMMRRKIEGDVMVEFIVDATGNVVQPRVVKSTREEFEAYALAAVEAMKFKPGIKNGHPVATRMMQPVSFRITNRPGSSITRSSPPASDRSPPSDLHVYPEDQVDAKPRALDALHPEQMSTQFPRGGSAVLHAVVDGDGHVREAAVATASDPNFGRACRDALLSAVYLPGRKGGRPVRVQITVVVETPAGK